MGSEVGDSLTWSESLDRSSCNELVDKANDLLIYRKFDKCLDVCQNGLAQAKNFPENESAVATVEALSVIAIQAFAELDRWQEVLPFINEIYTSMENCPPQVAQLCVLLHAHVRDYMTCAAITNVWVKHPHNFDNVDYHIPVEAFITKVLLPQDRWDDIGAFLDSCPGLKSEQKDTYMKQVRHLRHRAEEASLDKIEELPLAPEDCTIKKRDDDLASDQFGQEVTPWSSLYSLPVKAWTRFSVFVEFVSKWVSKHVPLVGLNIVKSVALMAVILYMLITRANLDFLSFEKLYEVGNVLGKLWRAMFAPFHLAKK